MLKDYTERGKKWWKKGRKMSLPIPICPVLKGEETVMMIIRQGNIFPPLIFPANFPDSPHRKGICVCGCVSEFSWRNSRFSQESWEWCSKCLFCVLGINSWKICRCLYDFLILSCFPDSLVIFIPGIYLVCSQCLHQFKLRLPLTFLTHMMVLSVSPSLLWR